MAKKYAWDDPGLSDGNFNLGGGGTSGVASPTGASTACPPGEKWDPSQGMCVPRVIQVSTNVPQAPIETTLPGGPCPGGETREASSGLCLCPGSQCRDIGTKQCREPNRGEKQNWTDDIERATGGGRGYCRPRDPGWETGGTGGGGGGAAKAPSQDFSGIWSQIEGLLQSPSRYTPEVLAQLTGAAKGREAGQNAASKASIDADTARRGIFRSPIASALVQKARVPAAEGFNKAANDIQIAKVNADAQDRMFAVQSSMQWVQMMMQGNQFDANLQLAYSRLQQEMKMLQMQLSDPYRLLSGVI